MQTFRVTSLGLARRLQEHCKSSLIDHSTEWPLSSTEFPGERAGISHEPSDDFPTDRLDQRPCSRISAGSSALACVESEINIPGIVWNAFTAALDHQHVDMICSHIGVRPREVASQVSLNQTARKGIAESPYLLRRYSVAQVQIRH